MTDQDPDLLPLLVSALEDAKARAITTLNVRELTSVADTMIIANGTSSQHIRAISEHLVEAAKHSGHEPLGVEGKDVSDWVLVDLGEILVHLMSPTAREFYDLERLWSMPAAAHGGTPEDS